MDSGTHELFSGPQTSANARAVLSKVMINVFFVRYMCPGRWLTPCPHRLTVFFVRAFTSSRTVLVCPPDIV